MTSDKPALEAALDVEGKSNKSLISGDRDDGDNRQRQLGLNIVAGFVNDVGHGGDAMAAAAVNSPVPSEEPVLAFGNNNQLDHDAYATRKSASQVLFNFGLLLANISMLRSSFKNPDYPTSYVVDTCLIASICLQVFAGAVLIYLGKSDITPFLYHTIEDRQRLGRVNLHNNIVSVISFLIAVLNVIAYGLLMTDNEEGPSPGPPPIQS